MNVACPRCSHVDQVEKLTLAYEKAVTPVADFAGRISEAPTALRAKLAPPDEPKYRAPSGCHAKLLLPIMIGAVILFCGGHPAGMVAGVVLFVLGIVLAGRVDRREARLKPEADANRAREMAQCEQAMAVWHRAYYCHRDDWVFVPDLPDHSGYPANQLAKLLDDPALTPPAADG